MDHCVSVGGNVRMEMIVMVFRLMEVVVMETDMKVVVVFITAVYFIIILFVVLGVSWFNFL